jgi:hypothetical protein
VGKRPFPVLPRPDGGAIRPREWDFTYVCLPCGDARRALVEAPPYSDCEVWSMHTGPCDCCGETRALAHVRDFRRPWNLPLRSPG